MKYMAVSDINLSASFCSQTPPGSWGILWHCQQYHCECRTAAEDHLFSKIYPKIPFTELPSPCHHSCTWLVSCCELCCCQVSVGRGKAMLMQKELAAFVSPLSDVLPLFLSLHKSLSGEENSRLKNLRCTKMNNIYIYFSSLAGSSC